MSISQEALDAAIAKALIDGKTAATAEFASKDQELVQLRVKVRSDRIGGLIKGWKAEGKVLPAEEVGLAEFMGALEDAESEFTFAAGEGKEAKKTPAAFYAEFMAARTPLIKLGRTMKTSDDPGVSAVNLQDSRAIAKAASTFQAAEAQEGRVISIEAAVTHVTSQGA